MGGHQYARALGTYMNTTGISDLTVWTSTLVRTQQTAQFVNAPNTVFKELNEINAGKFEDFTFTEVMQSHPQEYAARQKDKLCYRYPQGMRILHGLLPTHSSCHGTIRTM